MAARGTVLRWTAWCVPLRTFLFWLADIAYPQWPYIYDSCDVGTLPNQTLNNAPIAALESGSDFYNGTLSYLPGQRLSRCTCPGESHPGPMHHDGTYVGRSAPEIDIFGKLLAHLRCPAY